MYSGLQYMYVFKGGLGILQMLMWRYHFWRILGYVLGERAIDWGKLFQTDIVLGKKENL
jgi:hypothetical protein